MLLQEEIKTLMKSRGYELHHYSSNGNQLSFMKRFDHDTLEAIKFNDALESNVVVTCRVDVNQDRFEFSSVTKTGFFTLSSSEMGTLKRKDFSTIETKFAYYTKQISIN